MWSDGELVEGGSSGESKYAEIIGRRHYWVICDGEVVGRLVGRLVGRVTPLLLVEMVVGLVQLVVNSGW